LVPPTLRTAPVAATTAAKKPSPTTAQSLIEKYGLTARVPSRKGKEKDEIVVAEPEKSGKWEDTREKRERELRERKERMVLDARRRLLEKQAKEVSV
ncbi:hypothetical protein P7C73_g918, partial [Tremellales sp. Uapishka_1]